MITIELLLSAFFIMVFWFSFSCFSAISSLFVMFGVSERFLNWF